VRAIDNAEHEILVGAYGLTTGTGIVEALLRAHRRGVDVELIADKTTPCGQNSGVDTLASAGVPVWIDYRARACHFVDRRSHLADHARPYGPSLGASAT
jgi:phosphatidylserine/phosphatidylglycerophosphate/cardiolipin synthase-like enzyme